MKKIGKGCLGCLGILALLVIVGVGIGLGTKGKPSHQTTEEAYSTYTQVDAIYHVPSSWAMEETEEMRSFHPDEDSLLQVRYVMSDGQSILDESTRTEFVKGLKGSATVSDETKYHENGKEGYVYTIAISHEGQEFLGKLYAIDAPQGTLVFLYASNGSKTKQYLQVLKKIVGQLEFEESAADSVASSSAETSSSSSEVVTSSFVATDTSDATIESIVTYGDYLDMYELIVNEYVSNYEAAVAQYGLADVTAFQGMRDQITATIEQQKAQYGSMKDMKIVGKEKLVQYLKEYRDQLKGFTDQMAAGF